MLTVLNVTNNKIENLPGDWSNQMTKLRHLDISCNRFAHVLTVILTFSQVCVCVCLGYICICMCVCIYIYIYIYIYVSIYVTNIKIEKLLGDWSNQMTKLRHLDISCNRFAHVPTVILTFSQVCVCRCV